MDLSEAVSNTKLNEIKEKLIQKGGEWPPAPV